MISSIHIDPAAVEEYRELADRAGADLAAAAQRLTAGTDPDRVAAGLGPLGGEFVAEFVAAVTAEQAALSHASALVVGHSAAIHYYLRSTTEVDSGTSTALTESGEQL